MSKNAFNSSPSGHEENDGREATPPASLCNEVEGNSHAPTEPRPLRHREKELDEALRQLLKEHAEVRQQLVHRGDGSYAHAHPREVNQQIANNHADLPNSARASLNIAAAAAILIALPEPMTPDEHRECDKLHIFLERVAQQ